MFGKHFSSLYDTSINFEELYEKYNEKCDQLSRNKSYYYSIRLIIFLLDQGAGQIIIKNYLICILSII
jgi:hypothetical protein